MPATNRSNFLNIFRCAVVYIRSTQQESHIQFYPLLLIQNDNLQPVYPSLRNTLPVFEAPLAKGRTVAAWKDTESQIFHNFPYNKLSFFQLPVQLFSFSLLYISPHTIYVYVLVSVTPAPWTVYFGCQCRRYGEEDKQCPLVEVELGFSDAQTSAS